VSNSNLCISGESILILTIAVDKTLAFLLSCKDLEVVVFIHLDLIIHWVINNIPMYRRHAYAQSTL
jgi:hypothetical protein